MSLKTVTLGISERGARWLQQILAKSEDEDADVRKFIADLDREVDDQLNGQPSSAHAKAKNEPSRAEAIAQKMAKSAADAASSRSSSTD